MSQTYKIGSHKTTIYTNEEGLTCVKYWNTDVIKFNESKIILNSGGYYTVTTKTRINQAFNQYNLNCSLFQKKGEWFVKQNEKVIPFLNNMVISRI